MVGRAQQPVRDRVRIVAGRFEARHPRLWEANAIDLEEAARIDGCSQLEAFTRVLLPLSTPALSIVFLFNFLTAWSEFFAASILVGSREDLLTWTLGLQRFQAQFQTQWADLSAASILISIPVVALFLYSSKYLISGITLGGVKG